MCDGQQRSLRGAGKPALTLVLEEHSLDATIRSQILVNVPAEILTHLPGEEHKGDLADADHTRHKSGDDGDAVV